MGFVERARKLPALGVGISTEYGIRDTVPGAVDPLELRRRHPAYARVLEVGVETAKGLDHTTRAWLAQRLPVTYHFLDVNLDDPHDFDPGWLAEVQGLVRALKPAWMCGDVGLWHLGRRERGHMLLLPPVLCPEQVRPMAEGLRRLRELTGLEVLPENPPGLAFVGPLHLMEFLARLAEEADTGLLLDCAHWALYQQQQGYALSDGLDHVPWERVTELHVAGTSPRSVDGWICHDDDHTPVPSDATWWLYEECVRRAPNLKCVVFECERNPLEPCLPAFDRITGEWERRPRPSPSGRSRP